MSPNRTKELTSKILSDAGFDPLPVPFKIAGVSFNPDAAFLGAGLSPDLILLINSALHNPHSVEQIVEGSARALDVTGSRRPLSTIIIGQKPNRETLESISRVSRVLLIDQPEQSNEDTYLRDRLAVLLPLNLPEPHDNLTNPIQEIESRVGDLDKSVGGLVPLSKKGSEAVSDRFREILNLTLSSEKD